MFLKALAETMALKKLTSSVILNVTGNFSAMGQQDSHCRNAVYSICDCSFKLLASVSYFSLAYHKFKPRSYLTFAPLCNHFRAVQNCFHSAGDLFFKEWRLIPTTCVASVLLSSCRHPLINIYGSVDAPDC